VGAFQYYDRVTDDARMTLATIRSAYAHGALALNYAEVQALLKSQGRVSGLAVRDRTSGETFDVHAKVVVNATGAWNDAIRLLDGEESPRTVRPNKGIHVIVPRTRLRLCNAVDFAALGVKRTLYAIPWRHTAIVGTTDTDYSGDLDQVCAEKDEVEMILTSLNHAFKDAALRLDDVLSTYAGVRPLVAADKQSAYRMSREHRLSLSGSGLISITGGKFTTHRAMAKEVVDLAAAQLDVRLPCRTDRVPLDERIASAQDAASLAAELPAGVAQHLVSTYGSRCADVWQAASGDKYLQRPVVAGLPNIWAEVPYAVEHEMALTLNDVMIRRMHLIHEDKAQGLADAPAIAAFMGKLLDWTPERISKELAAYEHEVALTRHFREG
jgi:glycerol-3-phosphate dehydrogenase